MAGVDRGETPVVQQPCVSNPVQVKVICMADERVNGVRPTITIYGLDVNGLPIRTQVNGVWQDGETVELAGDDSVTPYRVTANSFVKITQVSKPVTRQTVTLHMLDAAGLEYFCAQYRYNETNPIYRSYSFPVLIAGTVSGSAPVDPSTVSRLFQVLVRRRFIPAQSDSDLMFVPSLPAMQFAVKAVAKANADDLQASQAYMAEAVRKFRGDMRTAFGWAAPNAVIPETIGFGTIDNW